MKDSQPSLPLEQGQETPTAWRPSCELFLISLLVLFLELACIRWFPAHVLFLTFFTNMVLLACFLGMSVGCLTARSRRRYLKWTPMLLALALASAHGVESLRFALSKVVDIAQESSPQMIFFGTETNTQDVARFVIPLEVLGGFFFLIIALAMVGPGQELGRAFNQMPHRIRAYTLNILGSIVGIALFTLASWCELSPFWWFLAVGLGLAYLLFPRPLTRLGGLNWLGHVGVVAAGIALATMQTGNDAGVDQFWSPYYRIDYEHDPRHLITANLIGHQEMVSRDTFHLGYALPHALNRDAGGDSFKEVLVIGAGSGNDVSNALQWGAGHVDAVEIDPVIQRLGQQYHPDSPYQDNRVTVHLDDGRNYLRSCERRYDLIVYALVDSLVLHSSYSNIRLESYLFTRQAFADIRRCLKPDGVFVMYNYFRQGWLVARLHEGLQEAFGAENPLVYTLPSLETIQPEQQFSGFTVFLAGNTEGIRNAFHKQPEYWVHCTAPLAPVGHNGFTHPTAVDRARWRQLSAQQQSRDPWQQFRLAQLPPAAEPVGVATDDWPFLYLRQPMLPAHSLRGMAVMGWLALVLLVFSLPRKKGTGRRWTLDGQMFFLGAGFMLLETRAVVHLALLFGSTWMVNAVVFLAILIMILAANLFVLRFQPNRLWPYYTGLLAMLAVNALVPLDFFLGMSRGLQVAGACLLVFAPICFAGVIFAVSFGRATEPDRAFGANIAGAMLGGLAEYASMLLGFQYLILVALGFYLASAVLVRRVPGKTQPETRDRQPALPRYSKRSITATAQNVGNA